MMVKIILLIINNLSMHQVNDCFIKVKKDCFKFISSQETKKDKFKNKDKMIKSFLIPASYWIAKKANKKKPLNDWFGQVVKDQVKLQFHQF